MMKKEEILQNNKLIAEFMGVNYEDLTKQKGFFTRNNYKYSWNCLIPVIEKIGDTCEEPEVLDNYMYIMIYGGQIRISLDIKGVYQDAIEYINWYNKEQSLFNGEEEVLDEGF